MWLRACSPSLIASIRRKEDRSRIASEAAKRRWTEQPQRMESSADMPRVLEGYSNVLDLDGTKLPCPFAKIYLKAKLENRSICPKTLTIYYVLIAKM